MSLQHDKAVFYADAKSPGYQKWNTKNIFLHFIENWGLKQEICAQNAAKGHGRAKNNSCRENWNI